VQQLTATYNYSLAALWYAATSLTSHTALAAEAAILASLTALAVGRERMTRPQARSVCVAAKPRSQKREPGHPRGGWNDGERKQNEEEQRPTERKYRNMFDEAAIGMFRSGADGHLLDGNRALAGLFGYASPGELLARIEPLWNGAGERGISLLAGVQATGQVQSFELELRRKDDSKVWVSISMRAEWQKGELVGYSGSLEDVTERRRLREQALQSQKLESVGQLAAGIAHEINTPVQYIGDNLRFLKDAFAGLLGLHVAYTRLLAGPGAATLSPELREEFSRAAEKVDFAYLQEETPKAIEQALEGVSRVGELVGAMKEFSQTGTAGKVAVDLNRAIESTVTVARNEWKYVANMKLELDPNLPLVICLGGEFKQVILSLIVNAAQAIEGASAGEGPGQGLITIRSRSLPGWVEVRIEDTGCGIAEKIQPRIFDPFFTTREIGKGMGQGLAIARSVIVDRHQGTLEFETEEGHGTSFVIRLPCAAAQPGCGEERRT
jgi:PAS domain S-box-containing protein